MTDRPIDLTKPVIWTSLGNVNEDELDKFCDFDMPAYGWACGEQFTRNRYLAVEWAKQGYHVIPLYSTVVCVIGARLKSTGEVVKRGVYVQPEPQQSTGTAASFH